MSKIGNYLIEAEENGTLVHDGFKYVDPNYLARGKIMNLNQLQNVVICDIHMSDYPDFCDAYIESAEHPCGTPLSDEELDHLSEIRFGFVNAQIHEHQLYL